LQPTDPPTNNEHQDFVAHFLADGQDVAHETQFIIFHHNSKWTTMEPTPSIILETELDALLAKSLVATTFPGAYPTDFRGIDAACTLFAKVRCRGPNDAILLKEFVDFMGVINLRQLKAAVGHGERRRDIPRWMAAVRRIGKGRHVKRRMWRKRRREATTKLQASRKPRTSLEPIVCETDEAKKQSTSESPPKDKIPDDPEVCHKRTNGEIVNT
jgi:hypothetical protein